MKIAVTGATGFVGRPLCAKLSAAGHSVVMVRRVDPLTPLPPEKLQGAEAVVHLAGENIAQRWTAAAKRRIRESRTEGTQVVAEAARRSGTVRVFVSASGVGYYGDRGDAVVDESSPPGEDFLAQVCVSWEAAALSLAEAGLRACVVRLGVVLHPEGGALRKMLPAFKMGAGGPMGSGEQYLSWIHRDDAVRLFQHALEHPGMVGPVNAVAPNSVKNREFARALGHVLHRPARVPVPSLALRAMYGEMSQTVLGGQRVVSTKLEKTGFSFLFPELEGALVDLLRPHAPRAE